MAGALPDVQVDLNSHPIDAALFATSTPLSKGAILADEVGLGKTHEAGLLIAQRWGPGAIARVCQSVTAATRSIITTECRGKSATPRTDRACRPASPKAISSTDDAVSITDDIASLPSAPTLT